MSSTNHCTVSLYCITTTVLSALLCMHTQPQTSLCYLDCWNPLALHTAICGMGRETKFIWLYSRATTERWTDESKTSSFCTVMLYLMRLWKTKLSSEGWGKQYPSLSVHSKLVTRSSQVYVALYTETPIQYVLPVVCYSKLCLYRNEMPGCLVMSCKLVIYPYIIKWSWLSDNVLCKPYSPPDPPQMALSCNDF